MCRDKIPWRNWNLSPRSGLSVWTEIFTPGVVWLWIQSESVVSLSISICLWLHPLHLCLSLSSFNLSYGLFPLNPAPLYTPPPPQPPPVGDSLPAVSMVTSLLIVCGELWLFSFGGAQDENECLVSCFFRWKNFSGFCDVIRSLCVYRSASGNFQNLPWNHKTFEDSVWFWWYVRLKIMFICQNLLDEKTTLLFVEYIRFMVI